jgi:aspartate aminotransferase-like enzyme
MINLSTGPVAIRPEVWDAFSAPSISHRSQEFTEEFRGLKDRICEYLQVKDVFILTGSGTLANEAMIWQIKLAGGKGLVLSNGEFGDRLVQQAERAGLSFKTFRKEMGNAFEQQEVEEKLRHENAEWILCCHCETSSGQTISLKDLYAIKRKLGFRIYLDCMSTFATMALNLSGVSIATASSGKGIGSFAGLALLFSNIEMHESNTIPKYFDIAFYKTNKGIPFTISTNLVKALHRACQLNLSEDRWLRLDAFSEKLFSKLFETGIIPFSNKNSRVFTIAQLEKSSHEMGESFLKNNLITSFQSGYLLERNWIQLALMGNYELREIDDATRSVYEVISSVSNAEKHEWE